MPYERVLIVDDVLATGGTFTAVEKLMEKLCARVHEGAFLIDIRKEIGSNFKSKKPLFFH